MRIFLDNTKNVCITATSKILKSHKHNRGAERSWCKNVTNKRRARSSKGRLETWFFWECSDMWQCDNGCIVNINKATILNKQSKTNKPPSKQKEPNKQMCKYAKQYLFLRVFFAFVNAFFFSLLVMLVCLLCFSCSFVAFFLLVC